MIKVRYLVVFLTIILFSYSLLSCDSKEESANQTKQPDSQKKKVYSMPDGFVIVGIACDKDTGLPMVIKCIKDNSQMVLVPSGEFTMGSDKKGEMRDDKRPAHKIYLDVYYIDKYEVTNEQYQKFIDALPFDERYKEPFKKHLPFKPYLPESPYKKYNWENLMYPDGMGKHPVVLVSWLDACAYAEWAGKRLPTEAEWEKAARGADQRLYPWGNKWDDKYVTVNGVKPGGTLPVGSTLDISPYGCYDMAGNVEEWCQDWYDPTYYKQSPYKNPIGPFYSRTHVKRGGDWKLLYECSCSVVFRSDSTGSDTDRTPVTGFRCALSPITSDNSTSKEVGGKVPKQIISEQKGVPPKIMPANDLRIELEAKYSDSVTVFLYNNSSDYLAFSLFSPFDMPDKDIWRSGTLEPYYIYLEITRDGIPLPVKMPSYDKFDYSEVSVMAGHKHETYLYLSEWCDCSKPGKYTLQLRYVREKNPQNKESWWGDVTSNKISFEILGESKEDKK